MIIWDAYSADVRTVEMMSTILEEGLVIAAALMDQGVKDMIGMMTDIALAVGQTSSDSQKCTNVKPERLYEKVLYFIILKC